MDIEEFNRMSESAWYAFFNVFQSHGLDIQEIARLIDAKGLSTPITEIVWAHRARKEQE